MISRWALLALAIFGVINYPTSADDRHDAALQVFKSINERLSWMDDVALYKLRNTVAVEDLEREAVVVQKALEGAEAAGLDPISVEAFFRSQIAAAKAIQYRCLAQWQFAGPDGDASADLDGTIRPALIRIGGDFLEFLGEYLEKFGPLDESQWPLFLANVDVGRLTVLEKRQLFLDLTGISLLR